MNTEKLISMANQIGDFYEAYPDKTQVPQEIGGHLNKFWNSVMRKAILAHVQNTQGAGLQPLVIEAVKQHMLA